MKFADGFWLNQRGYEVNYATQTYEIKEIENGFLVVATPFSGKERYKLLGSANLEIEYTSDQENCIRVNITHHKGYKRNGPCFKLNKGSFKPTVTIDENGAVLQSGDTKVVVSAPSWSVTYYYKDKKLTSGGWRSTGVIMESAFKQLPYRLMTLSGATLPTDAQLTSVSSSIRPWASISTASERSSQTSPRTVRTLRSGMPTEAPARIRATSVYRSMFHQEATVCS